MAYTLKIFSLKYVTITEIFIKNILCASFHSRINVYKGKNVLFYYQQPIKWLTKFWTSAAFLKQSLTDFNMLVSRKFSKWFAIPGNDKHVSNSYWFWSPEP